MPQEEAEEAAEKAGVLAAINTVRSTARDLAELLARVRKELEAGAEQPETDQPWVSRVCGEVCVCVCWGGGWLPAHYLGGCLTFSACMAP